MQIQRSCSVGVLYVRKNARAMHGVGMKVMAWERVPLGIRAVHIDEMDTMGI